MPQSVHYCTEPHRRVERSLAKGGSEKHWDARHSGGLTSSSSPHDRLRSLVVFIRSRVERFYATGSLEHVQDAIAREEQAAQLVEDAGLQNDISYIHIMHHLGGAYMARGTAEGRFDDIQRALQYLRNSVRKSPDVIPDFQRALCTSLLYSFMATGRSSELDEAIQAAQRGVGVLSDTDHQSRACIGGLGCAFTLRFVYFQEEEDRRRATEYLTSALHACRSKDRADRTDHGFYLGIAAYLHLCRWDTLGQKSSVLDLASTYVQDLVSLLPTGSVEQPLYYSEFERYVSLYHTFIEAYNKYHLLNSKFTDCFSLRVPQNHMTFFRAQVLRLRFEVNRHETDLQKSISLMEEILAGAGTINSPKQSLYLSEVGAALAARYQHFGREDDFVASLAYYERASQLQVGFTADRFQAAVAGARFAQQSGRPAQAVQAFGVAVSLLPRIAWLGLHAGQRHAKLALTGGHLACDAAACAVASGQLERAVEFLDEGRSVLWRSILELRADLEDLQREAPQLAEELFSVGKALEHDDHNQTSKDPRERGEARKRLAEYWEILVQNVRNLDGFQTFLRPLPFSELLRASIEGPVVYLNVSQYGSDAIILSPNKPVRSLPLPGLGLAAVKRLVYVLSQALRLAKDMAGVLYLDNVLTEVARLIWSGGLCDVAAALLEVDESSEKCPLHVWWIPTGLLSLLPIHCAGPYEGDQRGIPDLFVSSYTTTIGALLSSRRLQDLPNMPSAAFRMLAIAQADAPGLPRLFCTLEEMQVLATSPFSGSVNFLEGEKATVSAVTNALQDHSWVHCCSHGRWDPREPLNSAFHLRDGPLTLPHLVRLRLKNADFAFLSACHTARHSVTLPDESLHIAAGLQVAGFRSVVATVWSILDRDGPLVSAEFYRWLTVATEEPDARNAAVALHKTLQRLRSAGMPLYRWAAFVHIGM